MKRIANWRISVIIASVISIAVTAVNIFADLGELRALQLIKEDFKAFGDISDETSALIDSADTLSTSIVFPVAAIGVALFICIIGWTHANSLLAHQVDASKLKYSTGWAVGSWLIPILNFWRPRAILQESLQLVRNYSGNLLNVWWGMWVINLIFDRLSVNAIDKAVNAFDDVVSEESFFKALDNAMLAYAGSALVNVFYLSFLLLTIVFVVRAYPKDEPRPVETVMAEDQSEWNSEIPKSN